MKYHPPRQRFRRVAKQFRCSAGRESESGPGYPDGQPIRAKAEKDRPRLNLVQHTKPVSGRNTKRDPPDALDRRGLQIEMSGWPIPLCRQLSCQRCFADLSRAKHRDHWESSQSVSQMIKMSWTWIIGRRFCHEISDQYYDYSCLENRKR